MGRKRHRDRIPKTVHFRRENEKYIEGLAEREDRPFSQMVDILVSRTRKQQEARP